MFLSVCRCLWRQCLLLWKGNKLCLKGGLSTPRLPRVANVLIVTSFDNLPLSSSERRQRKIQGGTCSSYYARLIDRRLYSHFVEYIWSLYGQHLEKSQHFQCSTDVRERFYRVRVISGGFGSITELTEAFCRIPKLLQISRKCSVL